MPPHMNDCFPQQLMSTLSEMTKIVAARNVEIKGPDANELFGSSRAKTSDEMSEKQSAVAKFRIQHILMEIQLSSPEELNRSRYKSVFTTHLICGVPQEWKQLEAELATHRRQIEQLTADNAFWRSRATEQVPQQPPPVWQPMNRQWAALPVQLPTQFDADT